MCVWCETVHVCVCVCVKHGDWLCAFVYLCAGGGRVCFSVCTRVSTRARAHV